MDNSLEAFINSNAPINQALLNQIISELKQGSYNRLKAMGIPEDIIKIIDDLPATTLSELIATPVTWAKISIDPIVFMRIVNINNEKNKQRELINQAITLNASNKMLANWFGITSNIAAQKRRLLGIPTVKGRLTQLSEEDKKIVWKEWKLFLKQQTHIDKLQKIEKLIHIAKQYKINLCSINQEIKTHSISTDIDQKLFEQLIKLKAHNHIIQNFFNVSDHKILITRRLIQMDQTTYCLLKDCSQKIKDKVNREWEYLMKKTKVVHICSLE